MNTSHCPIQINARHYANRTAVISGRILWTYAQLDTHVSRVEFNLKRRKISRGARIGICASNSMEYIVLLFALWRRKAVACPINPRFPKLLVKQCARQIQARLLLCSTDIAGIFGTINEKLAVTSQGALWDPRQDATIIFTSGTSAFPKAVLHTLGHHIENARGANKNIPLGESDRWLLSLPLYHVGGMAILFRVFLAGATLAVPEMSESLELAVAKYRPSHLSLVYTQVYRLLEKRSTLNCLKKSKAVLLGGGPMPEGLVKKCFRRNIPVHTTYGLTEMASQLTATPQGCLLPKLLTSGQILSGRHIKISPAKEILVKGKSRFKGYVQKSKILRPFDKRGWFKTGDLGTIDRAGFLKVLGRKDNMFISGGENLYPEEIEGQLKKIPGIDDACVVPRAHREYGFRPVAFLKFSGKKRLMSPYLRRKLLAVLPKFKLPDEFYAWPTTLLFDPHGLKLDRRKLAGILPDRDHRLIRVL